MIYLGVDLYCSSFTIVALSEGFAFLDKKYFHFNKHNEFIKWIAAIKGEPHEICWWFFDEVEFNKLDDPGSIFPFNEDHHDCSHFVYLINHRKLINFSQFFYEWIIHKHDFLAEVEKAYILASSVRIFEEKIIPGDVALLV